jgi:glycosyltransferase involved in cell wall biosynthesis
MKKKVLILCYSQFGYLTDTLKYCEYAKDEFDITYIGWEYGLPKFDVPGVKVEYISREGNILKRNGRLFAAYNKEIKKKYDVIFVNYMRGISYIKWMNWNANIILDIRTLSVTPSIFDRIGFNALLRFESIVFRKVSVISDGVARTIGIRKYFLLPLGADIIAQPGKKTGGLHLLYVGTLLDRDIIKCVRGLETYIKETGDESAIFTIVGDSPNGELIEVRKYVADHKLEKRVVCVGQVPHNQLKYYFRDANIGVSFVPMTKYFNFQPPTKTFEYLLAGLPVIATKTYENAKILENKPNAVLINDTEEDFIRAIYYCKQNLMEIDHNLISAAAENYSWRSIVKNVFVPMLNDRPAQAH